MIFSCTKKVRDKLAKFKTVENSKEDIGIYNWYADAINLERKNYFLFTNSKTRYTFFVYAGTKHELANIETIFEQKLEERLAFQFGLKNKQIEHFFSNSKYRYVKTNNRSIIGSMNDFRFQIETQIWHKGKLEYTYDLINHLINEVPISTFKYNSPIDMMKLEFQNLLK